MTIKTQGIAPLGQAVQQHNGETLAAIKADQARTLTASDTQHLEYQRHIADTSSGSITIALKPAADWPAYVPFHFQKVHASNSMIIDGDGSETVDGNATITITGNSEVVSLYSDGTTIRRWSAGSAAPSAAAPVVKTDVQDFGPVKLDLIAANADEIRFQAGFAGTLVASRGITSKASIATGSAVATVSIGGVNCTGGVLTWAAADAAGTKKTSAITAGGTFAAGDEIRILISGANTGAAFGGIALDYTRS